MAEPGSVQPLVAVRSLVKRYKRGNEFVEVLRDLDLDMIRTADWLLDLGPEGGSGGGMVVVTGTPEDVAATAGSHTGRFLVTPAKPPV